MVEFFYLLSIILFPRLFIFYRDHPVSRRNIILLLFINIISLFSFELNIQLLFLALLIILANTVIYFLEKSQHNKVNLIRFLSLVWIIFLAGLFTGDVCNLAIANWYVKFLSKVSSYFIFLKDMVSVDWQIILVYTSGILILLNEVNFIIRYFFEALQLVPKEGDDQESDDDVREYNTGRVIGMLERILVFIFAITQQYAGIGFIIAAKGIIRFKELDNKKFSEYVLIGTFLSALFSLVVAFLIKSIIY